MIALCKDLYSCIVLATVGSNVLQDGYRYSRAGKMVINGPHIKACC